ncbi:hypothetical protein BC833DRAFT_340493 [Globomyces pollinis-pini]|nr:hypothetical protein BC833DRAFT_340493 [Globomyces pollinis-pini]
MRCSVFIPIFYGALSFELKNDQPSVYIYNNLDSPGFIATGYPKSTELHQHIIPSFQKANSVVEPSKNSTNIPFQNDSKFTSVTSIFNLLMGLFLVFAGNRYFNVLTFAISSFLFAILSFEVLNLLILNGIANFESNLDLVYFVVMLIMGILGGVLFVIVRDAAPYLFSVNFGFLMGLIFLRLPFTASFSVMARITVLIGFLALGILSPFLLRKWIVTISSCLLGSYLFFTGLDYFIKSRFFSLHQAFGHAGYIPLNPASNWMLVGFFLLVLIGILFQYFYSNIRKAIDDYQQRTFVDNTSWIYTCCMQLDHFFIFGIGECALPSESNSLELDHSLTLFFECNFSLLCIHL